MQETNNKMQSNGTSKVDSENSGMLLDSGSVSVQGHIKIYDPNTEEVFVEKRNAIHYENMSESMAYTLSHKPMGYIYQMALGNGGTSIDPTGIITYLPPNTSGQNADLYNGTYSKVIDDNSSTNTNPTRNNLTVSHTFGKVYTDIVVSCLLDYGEPQGQQAFDNSTDLDGEFVFDELGLKTWGGSVDELKLITHVIFHPIQKSLNRQVQIDYTVRVQTLTNLSTA